MPLAAAHFTSTAGFQAASAYSTGGLAAITSSTADLQPAGARHYCAGTLAVISAAVITSRTANACTHYTATLCLYCAISCAISCAITAAIAATPENPAPSCLGPVSIL
jgi:hypothetical protein